MQALASSTLFLCAYDCCASESALSSGNFVNVHSSGTLALVKIQTNCRRRMGICASCCGGKRPKYGDEPFGRLSGPAPETEQDREARVLAAERAEARQRQFEQSAVGRAALKAVKDAKRQDERPTGNTSAQDWLT